MSVKNPVTSKKLAKEKAELQAQSTVNKINTAKKLLERDQAAVEAAKVAVVAAQAKTDETAKALFDLYKEFCSKN